jgi:tetratricopeptide (TPR) repeat protein
MRYRLILLAIPAFVTALLAVQVTHRYQSVKQSASLKLYKQKTIIRCTPDWNTLKSLLDEIDIPPIPGAGNYQWKITTTSDSAQFYFNQGINMYYGFHIIEAMASFKKAEKFDPNSAMIYWAKALTYGPNINDFGYVATPDALAAIEKAIDLSATSTLLEKKLIHAQRVRYTSDTTENREHLNQLYANEMKTVYNQFTYHADAATLYADALMLQHPWDLWYNNGQPKPWTPQIRSVLEKILKKTPNHPGANHYYIHVMEPSPFANLAIPSADRLGNLTPALSHMVHMPSHIYLRTGNYNKGMLVNEDALNSYKKVIELYAPAKGADFLYVIHNLHMKTNHLMLAGKLNSSVQSAQELIKSIPADYLDFDGALGNYVQYIFMTPVLVNVRFGRWDALFSMDKPEAKLKNANVLYHFGRGMAFAHQNKIAEANEELKQLQLIMNDPQLALPFSPFSTALEGATVANNLLKGTIALKQKQYNNAINFFTKAVTTEENMVYNEPRDWMLNPKHYLGNAYLLMKDWKNAEKVFLNDLKNNNNNIWALTGLLKVYQIEKKEKEKEALTIITTLKKIKNNSDISITDPVF